MKMSSPDWRWMNPNPFAGIEPLYCLLLFHFISFSLFELFGASRPPPAVQQKKGSKCYLQPL